MSKSLHARTVVVTGAAQGIGAHLARGIAGAGANVVIADILDGTAVATDIRNAGGQAIACRTDITDDASLAALVQSAEEAFDAIGVLVNNAAMFGTVPVAPLTELDNDDWDSMLRVNVRGTWQCVKAVLPGMIRHGGGSIINITTNRIYRGFSQLLHYDASKGAVAA
ncbi:MAG: SDR family oxidoreductase, partial [Pseudomonadota bacterium]